MTLAKLTIGFSPCPNDTFIFNALTHGLVRSEFLEFAGPELADVETLNQWALAGRLDVTKLSFHALGHVADEYVLLSSGSALGRGCGPILVTAAGFQGDLKDAAIAIPGQYTTAAMLLKLYAPDCRQGRVMRFDEIMPAIARGAVKAGVIIHESRFTYPKYGLKLLVDLGTWWEETTGLPIPLGGIAARRSLGEAVIRELDSVIRSSLRWAFANREQGLPFIKLHAQEMDEAVINSHINLYVNPFTDQLGTEGLAAVQEFLRQGQKAGLFDYSRKPLLLD